MSNEDADIYESEEYIVDPNPSEEDIIQFCEYIGIDYDKEPDLVWIARQSISAPLPEGWKRYRNKFNHEEGFFFNVQTGDSIYDHPLDEYYIDLVKKERAKKYDKHSTAKDKKKKKNKPPPQSPPNAFLLDDCDETSEEPPILGKNTPNSNKNSSASKNKSSKSNTTTINPTYVNNDKYQSNNNNVSNSNNYNNNLYNNNGNNENPTSTKSKKSKSSSNDNNNQQRSSYQPVDHSAEINRQEEELQRLQQDFENKKSQIEREHQQKLTDIKNQQKSEQIQEENVLKNIQDRKLQKENELRDLEQETKDQQKNEMNFMKSKHEEFVQTLVSQNNAEIERLKQTFDKTIGQISTDHEKLIKELRQKNEAEIQKIKNDHESEKQKIVEQNKAETSEIQKKHRDKISKMREKHEKQLNEIRSKAANQLETERKKNENAQQSPSQGSGQKRKSRRSSPRPDNIQEILNQYDATTKAELDKKKREHESDMAKLISAHSEDITKRNAEHLQLISQLEIVKAKCAEEIRKAQENAEAEKKNIMKKVQKEAKSAKRKEIKEIKKNFILQTQRVVTIKKKNNRRTNYLPPKLRNSHFLSISVYDDNANMVFSRPQMLFQVYGKHIANNNSTNNNGAQSGDFPDEMNLTFTDFKKKEMPPISKYESTMGTTGKSMFLPKVNNYETMIEIQESDHQKMKYSVQKMQQQFDNSTKKIENKMDGLFTDMNSNLKELRSFVQDEGHFMNKSSLEFHQQILDITRGFHSSLSELESSHFNAATTMNNLKTKAENQPTQIVVAPPPQSQYYSFMPPQSDGGYSFRKSRYRRIPSARVSESEYSDD